MPLDQSATFVPSTCPHDCPSTCALEVERRADDTIGKVRGARDNRYTAGVICAKVARYAERTHHPDRLLKPLLRVGDKGGGRAAFKEIGWEEALDRTAEGMLRAEQRHGGEAVWPYHYAGTMGLVQRDGIFRLRHAKGYSRQDSTICTTLADAGWQAGCGVVRGLSGEEIADAGLIVIWGGNPVHTQVNVMTHVAKARKAHGAKLVVVDPYRTPTAQQADLHLMPRPGTDGALACAVIHVLLREGLADRDYLSRYTDWTAEAEAHFAARPPAWAAAITGLSVQEIEGFARLYGATKHSFIRAGFGFSRSRNGAANMHAVTCLPAVTGAWRVKGGGALYSNRAIYALDRTLITGSDVIDPSTRELDQSRLGPILCGDRRDLGDGPPVGALFVQNTNPVAVCPESAKVRDGLLRDDLFTCVHEQFLTETAQLADVVLPATTFVEHDDIYQASGHTYLQVARQIISPRGEARSNHDVLCALARRLGAEHPGFKMTAWEIVDATLKASGLPDAETAAARRWVDCSLGFERMHFLDGFGFPDGRFRFAPDWASVGQDSARLPRLPDHCAITDEATADKPFRLVTAPARNYLNTSFTETPSSQKREGRPTVLVHPETLSRLGLAEGDRVRLGNAQGSVVVHARAFDGLQPQTLVVESIWPNAAYEEGRGINTLTSAEPGPPKGGAVFHDTAVWLSPA